MDAYSSGEEVVVKVGVILIYVEVSCVRESLVLCSECLTAFCRRENHIQSQSKGNDGQRRSIIGF